MGEYHVINIEMDTETDSCEELLRKGPAFQLFPAMFLQHPLESFPRRNKNLQTIVYFLIRHFSVNFLSNKNFFNTHENIISRSRWNTLKNQRLPCTVLPDPSQIYY
eukprot:g40352.t1